MISEDVRTCIVPFSISAILKLKFFSNKLWCRYCSLNSSIRLLDKYAYFKGCQFCKTSLYMTFHLIPSFCCEPRFEKRVMRRIMFIEDQKMSIIENIQAYLNFNCFSFCLALFHSCVAGGREGCYESLH